MDRRDFLSASLMTMGALTSAQVAPLSAVLLPPSAPGASRGLDEAGFRAMIGSRFHIASEEWRGHVRLAEVRKGPETPRLEQFTTIFVPEHSAAPAPGLYEVSHPAAGRFTLRIDGQDPSGRRAAAFALLRT